MNHHPGNLRPHRLRPEGREALDRSSVIVGWIAIGIAAFSFTLGAMTAWWLT